MLACGWLGVLSLYLGGWKAMLACGWLDSHVAFGWLESPVEGLLCVSGSQGPLWPVCCGRAQTLASVLWKGYFGLLRDDFGQCAVGELL